MADSLSNQSTLRKSTRGSRPSVPLGAPAQPPAEEFTTVMFSFCDEQFPYRTKIPGKQITLRQFKEYLPKKGNYRSVLLLLSITKLQFISFQYFVLLLETYLANQWFQNTDLENNLSELAILASQ